MIPTEALPYFSDALVDATRFTRISMQSTERLVALQLGFAKAALEQAASAAHTVAAARDVQELLQLRSHHTEASMERLAGYSRELYEVASDAQAELSKLAEERLAATAAAFDTYSRAARRVTDASVMAAAPKKKRN
jgi:phasin family protein